jgi:hypothetical protein
MLLLQLVEQVERLIVKSAVRAPEIRALQVAHLVVVAARVDIDQRDKLG